jgi:hypothetical protein
MGYFCILAILAVCVSFTFESEDDDKKDKKEKEIEDKCTETISETTPSTDVSINSKESPELGQTHFKMPVNHSPNLSC